MNDVRVIGIGSPFGIDTLGWQVVRRLKQEDNGNLIQCKNIELIEADRPGPQLIQLMQGANYVILIDAIVDSESIGKLVHLDKAQLVYTPWQVSSHGLDVSDAIALADKLNLLPGKLSIIGLSVDPAQDGPLAETDLCHLTQTILSELAAYYAQTDAG